MPPWTELWKEWGFPWQEMTLIRKNGRFMYSGEWRRLHFFNL